MDWGRSVVSAVDAMVGAVIVIVGWGSRGRSACLRIGKGGTCRGLVWSKFGVLLTGQFFHGIDM